MNTYQKYRKYFRDYKRKWNKTPHAIAYHRNYYKKNKKRLLKQFKKYWAKHKKQHLLAVRRYYIKNRASKLRYAKWYYKTITKPKRKKALMKSKSIKKPKAIKNNKPKETISSYPSFMYEYQQWIKGK